MDLGHVLLWSLIFVSAAAVLYGFHRLCLWLEKRGWLYYKHKKPCNSSASCFVALQQILEPPTQCILQIKEEKYHRAKREAPGQDETTPTEGNGPGTEGDRKPAGGNG